MVIQIKKGLSSGENEGHTSLHVPRHAHNPLYYQASEGKTLNNPPCPITSPSELRIIYSPLYKYSLIMIYKLINNVVGMETCIKIKILIAIMQATIISYQKSTKQKYKIKNRWTYQSSMDQTHHSYARHTSDTSQQPVRRPLTKPTKKRFLWVSRQKSARGRQHRSTTQRRGGALDL